MRVIILMAITLVAALAQAEDYLEYKMVSSAEFPFPVYVDSRSNRPVGLDYTLMQNAVERAWATWNAVQCAYPKVQSFGPTAATVPHPVETIDEFSVTPVWMLTQDADAEEIFGNGRLVTAITLPRAYAGVLQTCDIFFNGPALPWSTDTITPSNALDVETVALHEAGHCLGLGHFASFDAVMAQNVAPGESVRALTALDVQKFCTRYPAAGESASPCLSDGSCLQPDLKCVPQPTTNGVTVSLCTRGCTLGANAACDLPLSCEASNAFSGFTGACLLPGNIVTQVGRACGDDSVCGNSVGFCQRPVPASGSHVFWLDGYCTQSCEVGQPSCPATSACVLMDNGRRCLQSCRVGLADCRPEYACAQIDSAGSSGVCLPRCYADVDCAEPALNSCRTCDGLCVPRQNSSGQIGDICVTEATCGAGQLCRATSESSAQKQCTQQCSRGCGICPSGSSCTPGPQGELFCLRNCTGPGTCPVGLRCAETSVGKGCQSACQTNLDCAVGQKCFPDGECYTPDADGGCGLLCQRPDAGSPVVVVPDAGTGTGGTSGCGCSAVDPTFSVLLAMLVALRSRRRS